MLTGAWTILEYLEFRSLSMPAAAARQKPGKNIRKGSIPHYTNTFIFRIRKRMNTGHIICARKRKPSTDKPCFEETQIFRFKIPLKSFIEGHWNQILDIKKISKKISLVFEFQFIISSLKSLFWYSAFLLIDLIFFSFLDVLYVYFLYFLF